jgi:hypothetical protein
MSKGSKARTTDWSKYREGHDQIFRKSSLSVGDASFSLKIDRLKEDLVPLEMSDEILLISNEEHLRRKKLWQVEQDLTGWGWATSCTRCGCEIKGNMQQAPRLCANCERQRPTATVDEALVEEIYESKRRKAKRFINPEGNK